MSTPSTHDAVSETSSNASDDEDAEDTTEPLLKYRRVKASVVNILNGGPSTSTSTSTSTATTSSMRPPDSVTCAHLHPAALFLGTQSGTLYVLDHLGNELLHLPSHTARINISHQPESQVVVRVRMVSDFVSNVICLRALRMGCQDVSFRVGTRMFPWICVIKIRRVKN